LSGFESSGLRTREVHDPSSLSAIAQEWVSAHGGERGHSMGRYCPHYLSHQRVFAAFDDDTPIAFVSFHVGPVWTLDLMRHKNAVPKGVMHALVRTAIAQARKSGVENLSLASVTSPAPNVPFAERIKACHSGLHRFKTAFAPNWSPRYVCASGRLDLAMTILTLAIHIRWPSALPDPNLVQADHEDFSFAQHTIPCDPLKTIAGDAPHDERPFRPARHA
jgi:phosphatidylglycerol lysyltransferase